MRLGRSLAAAVGTAALVIAGALAGPAAADGPGFRADELAFRHTPNEPLTVSGVGCTPAKEGKPSSVSWSLTTSEETPIELAHGAEKAGADGTWAFTIDVPAIAKAAGLKDPALVGLALACTDYNGQEIGRDSKFMTFDSTEVDGTVKIISTDTDGDGKYDAQTFDIDLTGFTPGETVLLYVEDESINEAGLDAVTADASGRVTYRGPVPTDLPDGKYRFHAWNITLNQIGRASCRERV